ncbi:MAG: DNA polymerase II [Ignavibacteriaceae bacterium]|nr:DNA polymerase II [Ignavibacteriaceae bacterium]
MPDLGKKSAKVFILTGEWQDIRGKNVLKFIGTSDELGTVELIFPNNPVFFIERKSFISNLSIPYNRKEVDLKSFDEKEVDALYFNSQRDLRTASEELERMSVTTFEADVDPSRRFLMERFINAQVQIDGVCVQKKNLASFTNPKIEPCEFNPKLLIASIDIETGVQNSQLYSIAVHLSGKEEEKKVFIISEGKEKLPAYIEKCSDELELLQNFLSWFKEKDPDVVIGWHVIGFDLMFLENKCRELNISFDIARADGRVSLRQRKPSGYFASVTGRVIIDGPQALRTSFFTFEDYRLETVAQELLAEGKTITADKDKVEEIERLFAEDKAALAEYNLNDAVLVTNIFKKAGLIELSVRRSQLSGLLMDELGMMTAAFDHFFLPKLHRVGYVAPNVKDLEASEHSAGGYVMDPIPGIYDDVIVLDFKSLYPSIIQTFKIDPYSNLKSEIDTIKTLNGFKFSSTQHFLPEFIDQLIEQRNLAKKKNDKQLSQAIKILMNSFYGVMGSFGCRFYHPNLPTAITGTGHKLLLGSKEFLAGKGYEVIYGDTDSLFLKLKEGEGDKAEKNGNRIAVDLNEYWSEKIQNEFGLKSYLEIEFEKYYRKFILTPARGSESGAKKRYAGLLSANNKETIEFVGMEFVRSDWTRLAKEFQIELYSRIFNNDEIENWIREIVKKVKAGEYDDKLVYRKRLRKDVDEYTKNIPQHVKAARLLPETTRPGEAPSRSRSGTVYYVITKRGPIPVELKHTDIDYDHYIEKQVKPIADSVLVLLGESFDSIVQSDQLSFF